jgi:hypothetical protein
MSVDGASLRSNLPLDNTAFNKSPVFANNSTELPSYSVVSTFQKAESLSKQDYTRLSSYASNPQPQLSLNQFQNTLSIELVGLNLNKKAIGKNSAITVESIRNGAVLEKGQSGGTVSFLQTKLTSLGYPVKSTGYFGPVTQKALIKFQKAHGIEPTGKLGSTTLAALTRASSPVAVAKEGMSSTGTLGQLLAKKARSVANSMDSVGHCFGGVATALENFTIRGRHVFSGIVGGNSAYMAANQLARSSKFQEIKIKSSQLPKLPAGAVVVWDRTPNKRMRHSGAGWEHGHISIASGNGYEYSDHAAQQMTRHYAGGSFRVFLPKDTAIA